MFKAIIILMMMILVIIIMMVRMILPNASIVCGWAESIHFIGSTPTATTMLRCTIVFRLLGFLVHFLDVIFVF